MDISAIQVVRASDEEIDATLCLSEACELYLRLKGLGKDKVFMRTANGNTKYVTNLLGDRPRSSYSSNEAAQLLDCCIERGMGIKTVKRVFSTIIALVSLAIAEEGMDCSNAFAKTFFPNDIVDAFGGWKASGTGHGYGNGYPLQVLERWMKKI